MLPTREDVWGLVVNEAMACGLPVIATNMCGAGLELISNGVNGFIVQANDENELAKTLEIMLQSDVLTEQGNKALKKIKEFTFQTMATRCYEIFESNM